MNRKASNQAPSRASSLHPQHSVETLFDSEATESEDIDDALSKLSLERLRLECYDEYVYNDLPQYLVRISDMRLYNRGELWDIFRSRVDALPIDLEKARHMMARADEVQLRKYYKSAIKRVLKYAIFSHRWGKEELEFRDMSSKIHGQRPTPTGLGYQKLQRFCEKAKEYGCKYVWSDTCCINKESSSELEEAIRSMYRWYRDSFVCIVYLAESSSVKDFPRDPWFTRGWTLQELLAPERLRMYNKDWRPISPEATNMRGDNDLPIPNDKLSKFMCQSIREVTHIDPDIIQNFDVRSPRIMVSTKMKWASKRKTTRIEDTAYSLLGIFDIMMPIAYGEGERAFQRLLEAIAQRSGDPTFFAWAGPCSRYSMALPASPASYRTTVAAAPHDDHDYAIQKRGIQLKLLVIPVDVIHSKSGQHYMLQVHPMDLDLTRHLTIVGQFKCSPQFEAEFHRENSYAVGVVDFQFAKELHGADKWEVGSLLPDRDYFCMFSQISHGRVGSGIELTCRRIDTRGVLPVVRSSAEYSAPLKTTLLEHSRIRIV